MSSYAPLEHRSRTLSAARPPATKAARLRAPSRAAGLATRKLGVSSGTVLRMPREPSALGVGVSDAATLAVERACQHNGAPLSTEVRSSFERRMGADFGLLRVHTGPEASNAAAVLNAKAFTVGNHVVFGSGRFEPQSVSGRRLLAHELVHVVQQGGHRASSNPTAVPLVQREIVSIDTVDIVGDPHFYDKAKTRNIARSKASSGWPFRADLKRLWAAKQYDDFADAVRDFQVDRMGLPYSKADGILGSKTESALVGEASAGAITSMSASGRHFTKMEETGGNPNSYHNVGGNCLAGYEHLIHGRGVPCSAAELGQPVSAERAEGWFNADISSKEGQVAHSMAIRQGSLPLMQYQFDALVDIAYEGALGQSLVDAVNSGDDTRVIALIRSHSGARWGRRANLYESGVYFW